MAAAADFNVSKWLDSFGLKEYAHSFEDNGYDTYELCSDLIGEDLDVMEIDNVVHRDAIFYQAQLLKKGEEANIATDEGNYTEPWTQDPATPQQQDEEGEKNAYSEPWTSIPIPAQQQQQQGDTYTEPWGAGGESTYTEPWTQGSAGSPRIKPSLKPKPPGLTVPSSTSTSGGKSPKSPRTPKSPNKAAAIKQPRLAEPSSPAVAGEGAAQHGGTQLTKLQLKLKLRDELVKDHIDLSEATYRNANGSMDEQTLVELAEMYAERFSIESLEVFDAVTALWTHNNNQTGFATPHQQQQQESSLQPQQQASSYISPVISKKNSKDKKRKKSTETPKVPDNTSQKDTYIQPFDAVPTNQTLLQKAPEPPPKPTKQLSKPDGAVSKTKTMAPPKKSPVTARRPNRSSLTLPAPSSPNLSVSSTSSEEAGSGRGSKRNRLRNMFKKSSAKDKTKLRSSSTRAGGSMEDISESGNHEFTADPKTKRQSLQSTGLPRSISTFPALLYANKKDDSDSDEGTTMEKKLSGSLGSLTTPTDTPTIPRTESGTSSGSDQSKTTTSSRIKSIRLAPPTALGPTDNGKSAFEISNVVEVYVAGSDKPLRFTRAKSNEQLDKVAEESAGGKETLVDTKKSKGKTLTKPKKQGGFLSRLLKPKSHKDKHKSKTAPRSETPVSSESGITASISMPNIVAASVHSEYTDILDSDTGDSDSQSTHKLTPPQLPKRQHITPARAAPPRPSPSPPLSSPHHLLMIKSGSASSSELANSVPRDDIIEISVPKQTSIDSSFSMALQSPMDLDSIGPLSPQSDTHTGQEPGSQYTSSLSSLEKTLTPSSPPHSTTSLSPRHRNTITSQSTGSLVDSISRSSSNASQRSRSGSKPPLAPKPVVLAATIHRTSSDSKPITPSHKTAPSSLAMRRTGSDNTTGSAPKSLTPSPLSSPAHQSDSPAHQSAAPPPKPIRGKGRQSLHSPSHHSNTADKKYQTLDAGGSAPIAQDESEEGERVKQHRPLGYSATMPYKRGQQRPPKPARQRRSVSPSIDTSLEDLLALANLFHLSSKLRQHGIVSADQLRSFTTEQLNELPLKPNELLKLQKHL